MESKEKCEAVISVFNGKLLPQCKEPLLVKFADGGNKKKNQFKNQDPRWREGEVRASMAFTLPFYNLFSSHLQHLPLSYDTSQMPQNGVTTSLMPTMSGYQRPYSTPVSATYQTPIQTSPWMHPQPTQYIVQPHHMPVIPSGIDPNALHFTSTLMPQLTAQMSQLQLQGASVRLIQP